MPAYRLKQRLQAEADADTQALLQRHEAASIERLKFWHFQPSNGDDATPEEQHKEFLSKLVTRLLYACNYQQSELERQNQELQQQYQDLKKQHQELANLRRTVQSHEDATRALNSRVLDLEQVVLGPDAGVSSSPPSNCQLEEPVDHVVAMLGDISTFAEPTTINNQLDTLKTEVQQLQLPNKNGNSTQHYKMSTFQIEKFDDHTHQDPVLGSCAALSLTLGDREQYATFAEIIDKAREIIKTNRAAAHEKSTWQPTYVEKVRTGPRQQQFVAVQSDNTVEDPTTTQASREGDQVAAVQPRSNIKSRGNGKAKSASQAGNGQPTPPWVKFNLTEPSTSTAAVTAAITGAIAPSTRPPFDRITPRRMCGLVLTRKTTFRGRLQSPKVPFVFDDDARRSFQILKTAMLMAPVLSIYDPTLPTRVTTDAFGYGIEAVLEQHDDDDWHPVEYFSHKVPPINSLDDARKKELLAFVMTLKRWRHFLLGRRGFTWVTDNNPLTYYKTQDTVSSMIGRWMYFIDQFDFTPKHFSGLSNRAADALSRRPDLCAMTHHAFAFDEELQRHFIRGYESDPDFATLYAQLSSDHLPTSHYCIVDGYLLVHSQGKDLLCIPHDRHLRTRLLGEYHDSRLADHFGVNRTIARLRQRFRWPDLITDVTRYCDSCEVCRRSKPRNRSPYGELCPMSIPQEPGLSIAMNVTGPFPRDLLGHDGILTVVDRLRRRDNVDDGRNDIQELARVIRQSQWEPYPKIDVPLFDRNHASSLADKFEQLGYSNEWTDEKMLRMVKRYCQVGYRDEIDELVWISRDWSDFKARLLEKYQLRDWLLDLQDLRAVDRKKVGTTKQFLLEFERVARLIPDLSDKDRCLIFLDNFNDVEQSKLVEGMQGRYNWTKVRQNALVGKFDDILYRLLRQKKEEREKVKLGEVKDGGIYKTLTCMREMMEGMKEERLKFQVMMANEKKSKRKGKESIEEESNSESEEEKEPPLIPPEANWSPPGTKMDWRSVSTDHMKVQIGQQEYSTLVDDEVEINIIHERHAIEAGLKINRDDYEFLAGASGLIPFCGTANCVLVTVGKVKVRSYFYVLPRVEHEVLLGRAFLCRSESIIINKHDGNMFVILCDPVCGYYEVVKCANAGPYCSRNRLNPESYTFPESEKLRREKESLGEESNPHEFSLTLPDIGQTIDFVSTHTTIHPNVVQTLTEIITDTGKAGTMRLVYSPSEGNKGEGQELPSTRQGPFLEDAGLTPTPNDLQKLNSVIVGDAGGLPHADLLSESCAGRSIITLIDLYSRRFILRVDPTALAQSLRNYSPADPTIARWLNYIWIFDFEIERISGSQNRADGLSRVEWDPESDQAEKSVPVDAFLKEEESQLSINYLAYLTDAVTRHGKSIWNALTFHEVRPELVVEEPFIEEDPWGQQTVEEMMRLTLTDDIDLMLDPLTIEQGYRQSDDAFQTIGRVSFIMNLLLHEDRPRLMTTEEGGSEIKEAFKEKEYEGEYKKIDMWLNGELDESEVDPIMMKKSKGFIVRDGHLFKKAADGVPKRVVCGTSRQLDVIAALHDGVAGGHRSARVTLNKIQRLYLWKVMSKMVIDFCKSCLPCQQGSNIRYLEPLNPRYVAEPGVMVHLDLLVMPPGINGYSWF
ncbi:hypothetical protein CBR_g30869 [Chara braunii]|uniref:Integrase zinc-binding domain-containing protein n=1 Tax=Chara braunii TaxID=69332 RepID=A0A388LDL9_CHABU|nr:hypothetical protein CBR_g30869 [Chara braunii]|eukprot:GBG80404.1 hypothetical protein CBR_g30869 [Chara braunii]